MGFGKFISLWIRGAFARSIGLGDFWAGVAGNILTVFVHFYPTYEASVKDLIWQIPLYGLAAAMLYRLLVTPYELWRNAEERATLVNGVQSDVSTAYQTERARIRAQHDAAIESRRDEANRPRLVTKQQDGEKRLVWVDPQKDNRKRLIDTARNVAHQYTIGRQATGFREFLESQRTYADLRGHLAADVLAEINAVRTSYSNAQGAKYPYLVQRFLDDLDRLEREWELI